MAEPTNDELIKKKQWATLLSRGDRSLIGRDVPPRERVPLASPSLTWALSGGLVYGDTSCAYGPEGSGKSLISMLMTASIHQTDPDALVVLNSAEMRRPSPDKIRALGVDPNRLIIRCVNSLNDIFDWAACKDEKFKLSDGSADMGLLYLLRKGAPIRGMITDSIKAIRGPREMKAESAEDDIMGDLSKFLNPALREALPVIRDHNICNMFVQQLNMNMDSDDKKKTGRKYTIPSGMSLRHFCETMMMVERVDAVASRLVDETKTGVREKEALRIGHTIRVKVEKANLDTPFRQAEFKLDYNKGVVGVGEEVVKLTYGLGILRHPIKKDEKKGTEAPIANQYAFQDKVWIGWDNCVAELERDAALRDRMMTAVYDMDKKAA
jgi:RecA/RadA recombinase